MDAKFYIKNLTNSSKQNSGEGSQNETDPIKRYLNQLATKAIENKVSYFDILNIEDLSPTIIDKISYTTLLQEMQININSENKIGDENNYEFVIIEYPDNVNDYIGSPSEIYGHSKFIFINEENAIYFLNKFIKVSTKQFMKSVLYGMDYQNTNTLFNGLDINAKNFEEKIAINNIKFAIGNIVTNDFDLQAFYLLNGINQIKGVFDENEDKIMLNFITNTYGTHDEYHSMSFIFSNDASNEIVTININETNYKIVRVKSA